MNPRRTAGLASLLIGAAALAGCSAPVRNDGHMFERWADEVASIPIDDGAHPAERQAKAAESGARPAASPLKINLIDHPDGPNSRAAGLRAAVAIVDSELAGLKQRIAPDAPRPSADAPASPQPAAQSEPTGFIAQLAAYPNRRAAEAAWLRLKAAHAEAFANLSPRFEPVDLGARGVWTRLQAGPLPSRDQAQAVCAEAGVRDRWCVSPDRG